MKALHARSALALCLLAAACGRTVIDFPLDTTVDASRGATDAAAGDAHHDATAQQDASTSDTASDTGTGPQAPDATTAPDAFDAPPDTSIDEDASSDASDEPNDPRCPGAYDSPAACPAEGLACHYPQGNCQCLSGMLCQGGLQSCQSQGIVCGLASDGFGELIQCGRCASGQTCTGSACVGIPDGGPDACIPKLCGPSVCDNPTDDGCGHPLACGGGCSWFCTMGSGCPLSAPPDGGSCAVEGQSCSYWGPSSCCLSKYDCQGGAWTAGACQGR